MVDDELLTVGSANFSNRSMGFDTECNLAIEARGEPRLRAAIAALRNRLLGEHLGCEPGGGRDGARRHRQPVRRASTRSPAVRARCGRISPTVPPDLDALVPDAAVIDPERRAAVRRDGARARARAREQRPVHGRLVALGAARVRHRRARRRVALDAAARLARRSNALVAFADRIDDLPATPALVLGAYVVAGLLVVPVTLLIAATGVVFGPVLGVVYALAGALLSGFVTYSIGRRLGRDTVRRLAGARLNRDQPQARASAACSRSCWCAWCRWRRTAS